MQLQVGLEDPGTTGPDGPAYSPAGRHGWIDAADAVGAFLFLEGALLAIGRGRRGKSKTARRRIRRAVGCSAWKTRVCGRSTPAALSALWGVRTHPCRPLSGS